MLEGVHVRACGGRELEPKELKFPMIKIFRNWRPKNIKMYSASNL